MIANESQLSAISVSPRQQNELLYKVVIQMNTLEIETETRYLASSFSTRFGT